MVRSRFAGLFLLFVGLLTTPSWADERYVTAAINWPGNKAQFFFNDGTYVRYDVAADRADPGHPKPVTDKTWPGLGAYGSQIVAAFNTADGAAMFWLSNGNCIRYDIAKDSADPDYPRPVADADWPGLLPYVTRIRGTLNWSGNKVQVFLNDGSYIRYDLAAGRMDAGYPQPITDRTWPGLAAYASHIAGSINWANGKAYIFFDDGRYVRYDIAADQVDDGYPQPVTTQNWPGLYDPPPLK
jgi:hypothetical protein